MQIWSGDSLLPTLQLFSLLSGHRPALLAWHTGFSTNPDSPLTPHLIENDSYSFSSVFLPPWVCRCWFGAIYLCFSCLTDTCFFHQSPPHPHPQKNFPWYLIAGFGNPPMGFHEVLCITCQHLFTTLPHSDISAHGHRSTGTQRREGYSRLNWNLNQSYFEVCRIRFQPPAGLFILCLGLGPELMLSVCWMFGWIS